MKLFKKVLASVLSVALVATMGGVSNMANTAKAEEVDTTAYFMYASGDWGAQYWYDGNDYAPVVATNAKVTGEGEYTVGLDFTATASGSVSGMQFGAVGISNIEETNSDYTIQVKSFKVNGEEVALNKGYTCSDDGVTTRYNVYNAWVEGPVTDVLSARSYDGSIEDASATPLDTTLLPAEIKTIEVTFAYAGPKKDEPVVTPSVKPSVKPSTAPTAAPAAKSLAKGKKIKAGNFTYKVTASKKVEVTAVKASAKKKAALTVPATVKKSGVTYKVTSVGSKAFKGCAKLKKVTLGKNVTAIKANAFQGCKKLATVTCKAKLKKVAKKAFKGTKKIKVAGKSAKANKKLIKKSGAKVK